MPRDHAKVNLAIWGDPDFRKLPPAAQHLYLTLWTSPDLTYCGSHDWRPARLTGRAGGWTVDDVVAAANCLAARHFLVIDTEREEALVRSWIRWDGIMKQPRMAISCITAYSSMASTTLREVVVNELEKVHREQPELSCWKDQRVQEVLSHPSVSAKDLPVPEDPFGGGVEGRFTHRFTPTVTPGLGQTQGEVSGVGSAPPTTATATTTSYRATPASSRKRPKRPLPDDWSPNDKHAEQAASKGLDVNQLAFRFRNWARSNDARYVDWDATFRNWIDREKAPEKSRRDVGVDQWLA